MSAATKLVLITQEDISEKSMFSSGYSGNPRLLLTESDCACSNDGLAATTANRNVSYAARYRLPALHTDRLPENFSLAFNAMASGNLAIFNQPVLDLLNIFRQPNTLDNGVRLAGDPPNGLSTAQRLARLGLLERVDRHSAGRPSNGQPDTLTAWLHVTNDCNLRCPYCYVHKTPEKMEIERGRQAIDAVFRSALANNFGRVKLKYAGGEATLNFPLVLALHNYAQKQAEERDLTLDGVVLSNGVALTIRMIEELKARDLRLMISLDGIGEYHDAQRPFAAGKGSFTSVERTLDRLAAHHLTPSISITISRRNLAGLPNLIDYVLKRELPFLLNFYRENDCSTSFGDMRYADEQIIAAMQAAFAVIEANLPQYSLLGSLLDLTNLDSPHSRTCGVGQSYMVIDQRGGVAKCHMDLQRPVADISFANPLQMLRDDSIGIQNLPVDEKEGCRDCTWRYRCAGGCPALTYRVTGRYDVKSPNCRIYKALFPEVLRLEGLRLLQYGLPQVASHVM